MNNKYTLKITFVILSIFTLVALSCENKSTRKIDKASEILPQVTSLSHENPEKEITTFCYFAKTVDKDGYVNVRDKENPNSKILGRIPSGKIVFILEDIETPWLSVYYEDENNKNLTGYVHRSRIKYINSLEPIPSVTQNENGVHFILRNISVDIKTGQFNYELNKKYFSEEKKDEGFLPKKYKGKEMWGTDGTIPRTYYQSIEATVRHQTTKVPEKQIEDLFNANNEHTKCYYDNLSNSLYIYSTNSDAAGAYVVLFTIENGVCKNRKVEIPF